MPRKNAAGPLFGFLSLIFCFVSIASVALKAWGTFWICLFFCVVSLAVFVVLSFKEFVNFFVSRQLRYGTNVAMSILGVAGIMIFLNIIVAQRFDKRADLTESQYNSLSEQTKQILKTLDKKVDVIAFFSDKNSQLTLRAKERLELYQRESELISVSFKNPYIDPSLYQKYKLQYDGTIVFESKDRIEKVTTVNEQEFTSAFLKIIQNKTKKVYFLVGHEERSIDNITENGYQQVKTELKKQNYVVLSLSLLRQAEIPSDCDVLVIAGPKKPLLQQEIVMIKKYLSKGGKLFLLLDPSPNSTDVNQGLVQLMKKWGVQIGNDLVHDRVNSYLLLGGPTALHLEFELHDITRYFMQESIPFIYCRSVTPMDDIPKTLKVKSIAKTVSPEGVSWAETERETDETFSANGYTADIDIPGPVSIAVAVEEKIDDNDDNKVRTETPTPTRIVVIGDSDFAKDALFATDDPNLPAYAPLSTAIINWLSLEEDLITIVQPDLSKQIVRRITDQEAVLVQITSIFLIPLIIFIAGIVVWWQRREGGKV